MILYKLKGGYLLVYASLVNSYQWGNLNQNAAMTNKIQTIMTEGTRIQLNNIPSTVLKLKNRLRSPLTTKILEAIEEGTLSLIYSPKVKIPVYFPFFISKPSQNTVAGTVFLNNIDPVETEGDELVLNERKLKVSLESCYIAMKIQEMGESPKLRSNALLRSGSRIYSSIITECINRKHSIKMEPDIWNSLTYLASRYYIGTMLGCRTSMNSETMRNYCLYNCKTTDVITISKIVEQFNEEDFDNIGTFINKIKMIPEYERRLGKLTVSNFLESYINMYNSSMLLALETFNYLLYNILSVNESTYINNYQVLKNIVGDDGKKIYADLVVAVQNL